MKDTARSRRNHRDAFHVFRGADVADSRGPARNPGCDRQGLERPHPGRLGPRVTRAAFIDNSGRIVGDSDIGRKRGSRRSDLEMGQRNRTRLRVPLVVGWGFRGQLPGFLNTTPLLALILPDGLRQACAHPSLGVPVQDESPQLIY